MLVTLDELYLKVSTTKAHVCVHYTCISPSTFNIAIVNTDVVTQTAFIR